MKPCTLPMLRALVAMRQDPLSFIDRSFRTQRNAKTIFIKHRVVEGLVARGLAKMFFRKQREKGRGLVIYLDGAQLTAKGRKLAAANPGLCIGCGCIDARACPGGCSWVDTDWCSACDGKL